MAYTQKCALRNIASTVCNAVRAVAYRAYAIRPYKSRKTNTAKPTFDAGKIISDII